MAIPAAARAPFSTTPVSAMPPAPPIACAHHHAGYDLVFVGLRLPTRIVERLFGRAHRKGDELIDLALLLRLHPLIWIVGAA